MSLTRVDVQCRAELRRGNKLGGYAAVFDVTAESTELGRERLDKGSLDAAMKDPATDVRSFFNHDHNKLLGRQSAGTLRLSVDSTGLEYEVDLPDTTYARDLHQLVERGDIDGASFGFVIGEHTYDHETRALVHTSVRQLVDVSPVTFPAYAGATTQARSAPPRPTAVRSQLVRARARVLLEGSR